MMNETPSKLANIAFKNIMVLSLFILLISHITVTHYSFVNFVTIILGIVAVSSIIYTTSIAKNDLFLLVLLIYIGSHFDGFLPGAGGLFSIVPFLLFILFFSQINRCKELIKNEKPVKIFIGILIISNILGWIFKSPTPLYQIGLGMISFFSYIIIFNIVSGLRLTQRRIKLFVEIVSVFAILNLLISVNSYLSILHINSPIFPLNLSDQGIVQSGTFGSTEIYGEYGLLSFLLLLPFYFYKTQASNSLLLNKSLINLGLLASLFNGLLSYSKAVFILIIIGLFFVLLFVFSRRGSVFKKPGKIFLGMLVLSIIILISLTFLPLNFIFERINVNQNFMINMFNNPITGEGTSRELAFSLGLQRLGDEPWLIGYGWSVGHGNKMAWFGGSLQGWAELRADPHSLYYAIVPIFGWFGSIAFVSLIIRIIFKLNKAIKTNKDRNSLLYHLLIGLFFLMIFFLIVEYKMNATRTPGYFMMVWIWIGFGYSAVKSIKI